MREAVIKVVQAIYVLATMAMVFVGIILMMCESEDAQIQTTTMLVGLGLVVVAVLPPMIVAWRKEKDEWT